MPKKGLLLALVLSLLSACDSSTPEQAAAPAPASQQAAPVQDLAALGQRYAGRLEGLELHTHGIALSQFLDVQLNLKATMALDADVEFMGPEEAAELLGVHRATLYRALRGQETSQAEARRRGASAEDALTEADALAAGDQEGMTA